MTLIIFDRDKAEKVWKNIQDGTSFNTEEAKEAWRFFEIKEEYEKCQDIRNAILLQEQKDEIKLRKQDLAQKISDLNWINIQSDDPNENEKLKFIMRELCHFPQDESIFLLICVIESKELNHLFPDGKFKSLLQFNHL